MKNGLHFMTWKEIENILETDPVVIVPLGSMEQHGPHSPTGDFLACEMIAKEAAEAAEVYYLPVIPFGCSEYFRCYPGTVSLSQNTMYSLLTDVCRSLLEHGFKKIVFFNGHGGNSGIIEGVSRDMLREEKIVIGNIDIWKMISAETKEKLYGKGLHFWGHGGDPVTSVMMYLQSQNMRMDLYQGVEISQTWEGFNIDRSLNAVIGNCSGTMYFDMDLITKDGLQADPAVSSAEKGKILFEEMKQHCVEFVEALKKTDTIWGDKNEI